MQIVEAHKAPNENVFDILDHDIQGLESITCIFLVRELDFRIW